MKSKFTQDERGRYVQAQNFQEAAEFDDPADLALQRAPTREDLAATAKLVEAELAEARRRDDADRLAEELANAWREITTRK